MKKILIISGSTRPAGNSCAMAEAFAKGARDAGHQVETISLRGMNIDFCRGCMQCMSTGRCGIHDDMGQITAGMRDADVVVFASPVFYYNISGKLKTLLDRTLPLSAGSYRFTDIYLLVAGGDCPNDVPKHYAGSITGWADCFPGVSLKGVAEAYGVNMPGDIGGSPKLDECYAMGKKA